MGIAHCSHATVNIELQVIGSALRAVAEEMGAALVRAAFSANIKERRDCSTALFAPDGRMIAQAEHIPVHLGAMPEAVAAAMRDRDPKPGDVFVLNDPYTGGTHLPDITLVSRTALGFAVSRAHHADVGGMSPPACRPGSPSSTRRGSSSRPCGSTTRSAPSCWPTCATLTSGAATCAPRSPPPAGGAADRRAVPSARARAGLRGDGRALTRTPSGASAPRSRKLPDGRYEADTSRGDRRARVEIQAAVTIAGDSVDDRLRTGHRPARRRTSTARSRSPARPYFVVRCADRARRPRRRAARSRR